MSFTVTASEFAASAVKVADLNKRSAKAGIAATVKLVEVGRKTVSTTNELGLVRTYEIIEAELQGVEDVKLGEWTIAATLDHDTAGNIFRTNPTLTVEIPEEFRGTDATRCDHCNTRRNRNQTVLVWNETEGFKQVGSDCVKLFLGVNPSSLIAFLTDIEEITDEESYGGWGRTDYTVSEFVAATALVTEVYGFRPRSAGYGPYTSDITAEFLRNDNFFKKNYPELARLNDQKIIDRANTLALDAIAWIAPYYGPSEYLTNLRLAAARDAVGRNGGLLASLPNAFKRATEAQVARQVAAEMPASQHVGQVGDKVTVKATPVYTNRSEGYAYNSPDSLFVILLAEDGSKFYMNTTVETAIGIQMEDATKGTFFTVTGTVKAHKVSDKGEQITVLTRCKAQGV